VWQRSSQVELPSRTKSSIPRSPQSSGFTNPSCRTMHRCEAAGIAGRGEEARRIGDVHLHEAQTQATPAARRLFTSPPVMEPVKSQPL
jgi:hypothetical protein